MVRILLKHLLIQVFQVIANRECSNYVQMGDEKKKKSKFRIRWWWDEGDEERAKKDPEFADKLHEKKEEVAQAIGKDIKAVENPTSEDIKRMRDLAEKGKIEPGIETSDSKKKEPRESALYDSGEVSIQEGNDARNDKSSVREEARASKEQSKPHDDPEKKSSWFSGWGGNKGSKDQNDPTDNKTPEGAGKDEMTKGNRDDTPEQNGRGAADTASKKEEDIAGKSGNEKEQKQKSSWFSGWGRGRKGSEEAAQATDGAYKNEPEKRTENAPDRTGRATTEANQATARGGEDKANDPKMNTSKAAERNGRTNEINKEEDLKETKKEAAKDDRDNVSNTKDLNRSKDNASRDSRVVDKSGTKADDKAGVKINNKVSAKDNDKIGAKADNKVAAKADDKTDAKDNDKVGAKNNDKTDTKADNKTDIKGNDNKTDTKDNDNKTDTRPDNKTDIKGNDNKTDTRPDDKVGAKDNNNKTDIKDNDNNINEKDVATSTSNTESKNESIEDEKKTADIDKERISEPDDKKQNRIIFVGCGLFSLIMILLFLWYTEIISDCSVRFNTIGLGVLTVSALLPFLFCGWYKDKPALYAAYVSSAITLICIVVMFIYRTRVEFYRISLVADRDVLNGITDRSETDRNVTLFGIMTDSGIPLQGIIDELKKRSGIAVILLEYPLGTILGPTKYDFEKGAAYIRAAVIRNVGEKNPVLPVVYDSGWGKADSERALQDIGQTKFSHLGKNYIMMYGLFELDDTALEKLNRSVNRGI